MCVSKKKRGVPLLNLKYLKLSIFASL